MQNSHTIAIVKIFYRKCFLVSWKIPDFYSQVFKYVFTNLLPYFYTRARFKSSYCHSSSSSQFPDLMIINIYDQRIVKPCHPTIIIIIISCIWYSTLKQIIKGHELDNGDVIITTFIEYSIEIFFISWHISEIKNAYRYVSACPSVSFDLWRWLILIWGREKTEIKKNVFCDLRKDFPLEYSLIGMSSSTTSLQVFFRLWIFEYYQKHSSCMSNKECW